MQHHEEIITIKSHLQQMSTIECSTFSDTLNAIESLFQIGACQKCMLISLHLVKAKYTSVRKQEILCIGRSAFE